MIFLKQFEKIFFILLVVIISVSCSGKSKELVSALKRHKNEIGIENIQKLIKKKDYEEAFYQSAINGYSDIVYGLVEFGADINEKTMDGSTILIMACRNNYLSAARILIDNGANPFIEDATGLNAFNNIKDRKKRLEFVNSQDYNIYYRYKEEELNNLETDINIESKFYRAYKYNNQIVNYYEISSERSYNFTVNEDVYILLKITARNRDFNIVDNEVNIKLYFPYFGEDNYKITFEKGDLLKNYISGNKIVCELKIYLYDDIYNQSKVVENEILIKLNSKIDDDISIGLEFPRAYNKNNNKITASFKNNTYPYYNIY